MDAKEFEKHVQQVHMGAESDLFADVKEENLVNVELKPGDISIHHPFMVSSFPPHLSNILHNQYFIVRLLVDDSHFLSSSIKVHGSEPNTSNRRRCGLTIRYIPTSTQVLLEGKRLCVESVSYLHVIPPNML